MGNSLRATDGDLTLPDLVEGGFELVAEQDLSFDSLFEVVKAGADHANQSIVTSELLSHH